MIEPKQPIIVVERKGIKVELASCNKHETYRPLINCIRGKYHPREPSTH